MKLFLKFSILLVLSGISAPLFAANTYVTSGDAFIFLAHEFQESTPESYQYIDLNFRGIPPDSQLEDALQILVYLDKIDNSQAILAHNTPISSESFSALSKKILGFSLPSNLLGENTLLEYDTLRDVHEYVAPRIAKEDTTKPTITIDSGFASGNLTDKQEIFDDVKKTLTNRHFDRSEFSDTELMDAAIQGLTTGTDDQFTSYFPADKSSNFFQSLDGEYEGIGAYVQMTQPGRVEIVAPMAGSPAEAAGIRAGDIITHVDGREITDDNSLSEVTSWIKGPKDSSVRLGILRGDATLTLTVNRGHIIIHDVEYEKKNNTTMYVQIKNFSENIEEDFTSALTAIADDASIKKIVFDVRNNPGGYLTEVSQVLGYFVPEGEPTAIVSYGERELSYSSHGKKIIEPNNYEVIILQNAGSASASEIFTGTIQDYIPTATTMGEKSYGKGSVQTLKTYGDGSTLKYTSAKWFTGKSRTGIDGVGITPDVEVELDTDLWEKFKRDSQLNKALNY